MALNLKYPRVDFFDPRTGAIAREWNMFLLGLFNRTGAEEGVSAADLEDLLDYMSSSIRSVTPSSIEQSIRELGQQIATARNSRESELLKRIEVLEMRLEAMTRRPAVDEALKEVQEAQQYIFTS